jgi:hypothetical protein
MIETSLSNLSMTDSLGLIEVNDVDDAVTKNDVNGRSGLCIIFI